MSIFTDTIEALTGTTAPLHQAVANAHDAFSKGQGHLAEALDHIAREFQSALADRDRAEAALTDAQRRVDEAKTAALQIAAMGNSIDTLIGTVKADAPAVAQEVQDVVNAGQEAADAASSAVSASPEPATNG